MAFGNLGETLSFLVTADTGDAVAKFSAVGKSAQEASAKTTASFEAAVKAAEVAANTQAGAMARVERAAKQEAAAVKLGNEEMAASYRLVGERAKASLAIAAGASERAGAKVGAGAELGAAEGVGGGMSAGVVVGAAVAAGAIAKFAETSVHHYTDLAESVLKFNRLVGGSAEDSSRFVSVIGALGIDSDKASAGIFRLGREAESGGKKIGALGIEVGRSKDGAVDMTSTMLNVVDAYSKAGSAAERDTIAFAAFGKGGAALIPMLAQGREGLMSLYAAAAGNHEIFSERDLRRVEDYKIQTRQLGQEMHGLQDSIGRAIVPLLADQARGWQIVGEKIGIFSKGADGAAAAQAQLAQNTKDAAAAAEQEAAAVDKQNKALKSVRDNVTAVSDATQNVADAQAKVAVAEESWATKAKDVRDATLGVADATVAAATAQDKLDEALRQAPENLARSRIGLKEATFAVADAVRAHAIAVQHYGANSEEAAKADDHWQLSKLSLADATDAHNKLEKAGANPQAVVDARKGVANASNASAAAQERLNKALHEDPSRTVADAEKVLRDAVMRSADAQGALKTTMDTSKLSATELTKASQEYAYIMIANGVDPATVAIYVNTMNAAIDAKKAVEDLKGSQSKIVDSYKAPIAPAPPKQSTRDTGHSFGDRFSRGWDKLGTGVDNFQKGAHAIGDLWEGGPNHPAGNVTNITVNANTNASAQDIADKIAYHQTVRAQ